MKKNYIYLCFIILISFVVRFWKISTHPQSLSMDEVGFGYNAYSILKIGRDEFGEKFPLAFRNLGDYKLPVNVYLTSISIYLFGLNEFAVRLPSALLGALTPFAFISLLKKYKFSWNASMLTGLWLSLLGWHVFDSRVSYEAVSALLFVILGTLFFPKRIALSVLFFSLSIWTYNAERLFVPIFFIYLLLIYKSNTKKIYKNIKKYKISFLVITFFVLPLIYLLLTGDTITSRAQNLWFGKDSSSWTGQYLNYFDPIFWFWKGVNLTPTNYPDVGLINLIDIPVFILGVYALTKTKNKTLLKLAVTWFFIGPFPASFTRGSPSQIRALIWLPFFGIVMASGFEKILNLAKSKLFISVYIFLLFISFFYFQDLFMNHFDRFYGDLWHYGYKEVSQYACQNHDKYDKIIITDKYGNEIPSIKTVPYLYILFYCKWNPEVYLYDKRLYNVEMRQPQWRLDSLLKNTLLIGSPWDFPERFPEDKIMKKIFFPSGKPAFFFVETDEK